jgi:hypothetical protein
MRLSVKGEGMAKQVAHLQVPKPVQVPAAIPAAAALGFGGYHRQAEYAVYASRSAGRRPSSGAWRFWHKLAWAVCWSALNYPEITDWRI